MLPQLLSHRPMKVIEIPETDELLSTEPVPDYPYNKTFQDAASNPSCVLHTSGSTGLPKPIVWENSFLSTLDASRFLPSSDGRPPWTVLFDEGDRFYSAFPLYHVSKLLCLNLSKRSQTNLSYYYAAGLIMNVLVRAFYGTSNMIGPVGVLSTYQPR